MLRKQIIGRTNWKNCKRFMEPVSMMHNVCVCVCVDWTIGGNMSWSLSTYVENKTSKSSTFFLSFYHWYSSFDCFSNALSPWALGMDMDNETDMNVWVIKQVSNQPNVCRCAFRESEKAGLAHVKQWCLYCIWRANDSKVVFHMAHQLIIKYMAFILVLKKIFLARRLMHLIYSMRSNGRPNPLAHVTEYIFNEIRNFFQRQLWQLGTMLENSGIVLSKCEMCFLRKLESLQAFQKIFSFNEN